jgi:hypothetical protein
MLSSKPLKHVIDIGAYYNPIHLFLSIQSCPLTIIIIEPILNPLSILIPCHEDARKNINVTIYNPNFQTHIMFLPITFKHYLTIKTIIPDPETIVCIGCDRYDYVRDCVFVLMTKMIVMMITKMVMASMTMIMVNVDNDGDDLISMIMM